MEEKHGGGSWRGRLCHFIYWLVRVDPEVMSGSPVIDRFHMQAKAALLIAVGTIAVFAWGAFLLLFWPWYIALPLLCPVIVWIVLVDQFMGSAHWKMQGILRRRSSRHVFLGLALLGFLETNGTLLLRLGIALVTSLATAYSATMAMSYNTIAEEEDKERNAANAALRGGGEAEKRQLFKDMLGADAAAVKAAEAAVAALRRQVADARANREHDAAAQTDSQLNADCQLYGGRGSGCRRGRGPKYRAALIRQAAANAAMGRAATDLAALEAQRPDAERRYQDALTAFHAGEPNYLQAVQAVDRQVAAALLPPRNDPVMAYRALQKIYASPDGAATKFYSHLMLTLLITIELSYVLVSEYFGHASIYMTRLIARTRVLAAEAAAEYRRKIAMLFGGDEPEGPAPSYRILPRFGSDDD